LPYFSLRCGPSLRQWPGQIFQFFQIFESSSSSLRCDEWWAKRRASSSFFGGWVLLVAALAKFIRIRPVEEEKVGGKGFFFFLFFLFFFPFCWPNHRGNIKISYLLGVVWPRIRFHLPGVGLTRCGVSNRWVFFYSTHERNQRSERHQPNLCESQCGKVCTGQ